MILKRISLTKGSATNLVEISDKSLSAVIVDPPYADNVQYSQLADFFYVWLKRTLGHFKPEWFSTYLSDKDQEAVVNISRHRKNGELSVSDAREKAQVFYQQLMTDFLKKSSHLTGYWCTYRYVHSQTARSLGCFIRILDFSWLHYYGNMAC